MVRISRALIVTAGAALLLAGCSVSETQRPALTGPSELALSLNLTANPDVVTQDGSSQSRIVILARDANGTAVSGLPLQMGLTAADAAGHALPSPGTLSQTSLVTASDGRATVVYTTPPAPPDSNDNGNVATISVVPVSTNFANAVPRSVTVRLLPPGSMAPGPVAAFTFTPVSPVPNSPVTFDGSTSTSSGTIIAWAWDFGDGSTGSGVRPQHTYRTVGDYAVSLVVTDDNGRSSYTCTQTLTVNLTATPAASFSYSPMGPIPGQTVFFDASTSSGTNGRTIVSYSWNFGNGATAHGVNPTTIYAAAGTYMVSLVVTDDVGQTASTNQAVQVTLQVPTANFVTSVVGYTVYFDASQSTPSAGAASIVSYDWVFGDGTTSTGRLAQRTYTRPGSAVSTTYTITLTVTDSNGGRAATSKTVTITW